MGYSVFMQPIFLIAAVIASIPCKNRRRPFAFFIPGRYGTVDLALLPAYGVLRSIS
jgi:hypothetical protein